MKPLKSFKEFLEQGIVKKQSPNIQRAESLIQEAKRPSRFRDVKVEIRSFINIC